MLPFRGMKHIRKSLKELTYCLMNDGRARQHHDTIAMFVTGDTIPSSRRTGTGSTPVSTRGLGSFTTVTQDDSTVMIQTSSMMNSGIQGSSSNHPKP
ncbi:hypothetical protein PoB_001649100 [Plakobranchus ocellatus]|uniref:Uncharacterized protein n=1 Tax=Plakobranchus ocellatus TaxID=259542 RepID=A0AAV3Z2C4_9GAST|nr:hypothetical protein PoB_001649100 [Plakobranchus ocellatus]